MSLVFWWTWETFRSEEHFFVAFIGADCNRWLWNHKNTRFTVFVGGRWWVDVKFWTFTDGGLPKLIKFKQGRGGLKFWLFCDNIKIECPLLKILIEYQINQMKFKFYFSSICLDRLRHEVVGNKAKGRIWKRVFQENKARQIFRKRTFLTT